MTNPFMMIYTIIHEYFTKYFNLITNRFFGGEYFSIGLLVLAVMILIFYRDKMRNGYRMFVAFILVALAVVFNPLTEPLFGLLPGGGDATVTWFWIVCPILMTTAYALSARCTEIKDKTKKIVTVVSLSLALVMTGGSLLGLYQLMDPESVYKVRADSVELADELMRLNGGRPTSVFVFVRHFNESDDDVIGGTLKTGITQYTNTVKVYEWYSSNVYLRDYILSNSIPDGSVSSNVYLRRLIETNYEELGFDYVAIPDYDRIIPKMEYAGYVLAGNAGGYNIFRRADPVSIWLID